MKLKRLDYKLSVCKLKSLEDINLNDCFYSLTKTDEELSLVCLSSNVPSNIECKEDGFRAFMIEGILDFSLIGILAKIADILAQNKISIFVTSTYNTDYVLVKEENFEKALIILKNNGYEVE